MSQPSLVAQAPEMQNPQSQEGVGFVPVIAVIGTEGAGKTVLTCVLAHRFSTPRGQGVFLEPVGASTVKYVSKVWALLNQGEWPPSTPPGELHALHFRLHLPDGRFVSLCSFDAAGQDFRRLFESEQILSTNLPGKLQEIAAYCRQSNVVIFVVNAGDFIDEPNIDRRSGTEAAIKGALDLILQDGQRRACIVFTQVDKYVEVANKVGGWYALTELMIPSIFGAYIAKRKLDVFWVAAVADTEEVLEGQKRRRVPRPGFRSLGLESLMYWLSSLFSKTSQTGPTSPKTGLESSSIDQAVQKLREKLPQILTIGEILLVLLYLLVIASVVVGTLFYIWPG